MPAHGQRANEATPLAPSGTELAPAALRWAGLTKALAADDDGDLSVRIVGRDQDQAAGVLGWPSVAEAASVALARTMEFRRSCAPPRDTWRPPRR